MPTLEEIEAGKSPKGGYNKATLAKWGVPWPPPTGWKEALIAGKSMEEAGMRTAAPSIVRPEMSADDLLRKVVLAVVQNGHASDLYEFPDVLEYFGARTPDPEELADHHPSSLAR